MTLQDFTAWLYATPFSTTIRDEMWIIPTIQTVHIAGVAIVIGSALVCDLRIVGLLAADIPSPIVIRRYLRWMAGALTVLLATGTLLAVGEPDRVLTNATFWLKMGLVTTAALLTWLFRRPLLDPDFRMDQARWRAAAKPAALASLALWACVIFCGRWIAYTI